MNNGFAIFLALIPQFILNAQCSMCRAVLQNSTEKSVAEGINNGIIYLMAIPYILVGIVGFVIVKKILKKNET